jgi:hypothetical protein
MIRSLRAIAVTAPGTSSAGDPTRRDYGAAAGDGVVSARTLKVLERAAMACWRDERKPSPRWLRGERGPYADLLRACWCHATAKKKRK